MSKKATKNNKKKEQNNNRLRIVFFVVVIAIAILAGYIRGSKLGGSNFYNDEYYHVQAAAGQLQGRTFHRWNFLTGDYLQADEIYEDIDMAESDGRAAEYTRSKLTTYQVAAMYRLFGVSEASARLPSVFWGVALVILVMCITWWLTGSVAGSAFAGLLAAFDPVLIFWGRTTRMYAMLQPIVLLSVFTTMLGILGFMKDTGRVKYKKSIAWLILGMCLFVVAYALHKISLVIIPGVIVSILILSLFQRNIRKKIQKKVIPLCLIGGGLVVVAVLLILSQSLHAQIGLQWPPIHGYILYPWENATIPIVYVLSFVFGLGMLLQKSRKKEVSSQTLLALSLSVIAIIGISIFVFFTTRYPSSKYISHLQPMIIITAAIGFTGFHAFLRERIQIRWIKNVMSAFIFLCLIVLTTKVAIPGLPALPPITSEARADETQIFADYDQGYAPIVSHSDSEDVIFIGAPRFYYLQKAGLQNPDRITLLPGKKTSNEAFAQLLHQKRPASISWSETKRYISSDQVACIRYYGEDVSEIGSLVHVFTNFSETDFQEMKETSCVLSREQKKELRILDEQNPPRATHK